jgi:hypothetical protein
MRKNAISFEFAIFYVNNDLCNEIFIIAKKELMNVQKSIRNNSFRFKYDDLEQMPSLK